ncbi:MAG: translocation/assembly module TamB domain-containing protein [Chitinophagaceae bacterium]
MKWFLLSLLLILAALYIFIQTPFGQNWIARQVTKRLSNDLQTKISIKRVSFSLVNKMHLEGMLLEDRKGDTLIYAGDLKVRITDWFFFKKEAELKYIGLENALIKFQRTDSVWQQQFILDYFGSSSTGTAKKKAGIHFNLKMAELKNVTFIKKDAWLGENMMVKVGTLNLDADALSLSGNRFEINSLVIKDPVIGLSSYTKLKPADSLSANHAIKSVASWNKGKTFFKIGDLKIINGTFSTDNQTGHQPFAHFDGQHILFTDINAALKNSSFNEDTVFSQLTLTAKERSGLEIKKLDAEVKLTPQGMTFSKMELATNRSTLRNYFSMSYDDMSDLGNFITKVNMAAVFDDSFIDSDDIAFFAPTLKTWKKKISLKGKIRGTISNLVGKDMLVQAGKNTVLNGDIAMIGLPDINQTFIDFKANDFKTTYGDAVSIIPALKKINTPDLRKIQYINFKGSFTGFIHDFVTFGTIQTNLGIIKSDLNMKFPKGQDPVYSGTLSTNDFRLGEFLDDKSLGNVSLNVTVKGKGFNEKSRNTLIDGTIKYADYKNYRYENISLKGRLDKKLFEGIASIQDKNADLTLNGILDFNNKTPRFELLADVQNANFKNLKLTKDSITFKGKLNFNFSSITLDNFLGTARVSDAEITKNGTRLPFDSLILSSSISDSTKILTAVSNEFNAKAEGDFSLKDLPDAFTYFLNKYYPAYINPPKKYPRNQDISFDITTYYVDEYLQLIDSSIAGLNNSHFEGRMRLSENILELKADVPQFKFKQYNFDNIQLSAKGNADSLVLIGKTNNIRINDSLNIPTTVFNITARNDSSSVSVMTGANQAIEKADLNALIITYNDGIKVEVAPSTFTINGKLWAIDESGELTFRKNHRADGLLLLSEGDQKILLKTQNGTGDWSNLKVELTKVNLGDFAPFFLPKNRLEGLLSGTILVEDPTNNLRITSDDIQTQFLRFDNDSIGELKATLAYDNVSKELKFKGNTLNQENYLGFDGHIFLGDPLKAKNNIITLKAKSYPIKILERFLGTLFSDMQGYMTGDIDLEGDFKQIAVTGKGRLKEAGLKVNFTQCFYKIQDTEINLTPEEINLDGIILTDTVTKNPIYLTGGIEHNAFKNMFFNLDISTKKPNSVNADDNRPVQLLNTTYRNNKDFYGNAKGTGSLSLTGSQNDMYMDINVVASALDSSYVTLPPSSGRESGLADFLVERKYGREMNDSDFKNNETKITYDVKLTANPMVSVKVQLDELTGDEIKGRGNGTLNISAGTTEPLRLRGRFDIDEGSYLFTFQSVFKKPFELKRGEPNFIAWDGDPYDARMNLTAYYTATNVSFAPLANSWSGLAQGVSRARGDVYVVAKLTDKLFNPKIEFGLDFPVNSVVRSDQALSFGLQELQKDLNEMNKQATYLVVFGVFAPVGNTRSSNFQEIATNSLSSIFFNVINEQVKKIVSDIFKTNKINFNFNSSVYNQNILDLNNNKSSFSLGSNVSASIGSSLFKNRVIFSLGGSVEGLLQSGAVQQDVRLLPDFTIEILINPSGSFRATLFYRQNIDYLTGTTGTGKMNRAGAGLTYRKEADKIWDLFFGKKKKQQPIPIIPPDPAEAIQEDSLRNTNN